MDTAVTAQLDVEENQGRQTPPHHPIFGVYLEHDRIRQIIGSVFPSHEVLSIHQLPSGQSYNNRIYFVDTRQAQKDAVGLRLVLKVNGRFFGANKTQNEVGCLSLLETDCPSVPSPRVYAWSDDGQTISVPTGGHSIERHNLESTTPGWILMSRVPGQNLSQLSGTLDDASLRSVGSQVAEMVAVWRRSIPLQRYCGNLRFSSAVNQDNAADIPEKLSSPSLAIRGILADAIDTSAPIDSLLNYYKLGLENKLHDLESKDLFAPNRKLGPMVRAFINGVLPSLALVQSNDGSNPFIFTHYDLSPRNVLVSGSPPAVSGLVDFEFSGFFPALDEFVNDYVDNGGDWPAAAYEAYLERLGELGVPTPAKGVDKNIWRQAVCLGKLVNNLAPWWLPGPHEGDELLAQLLKAEEVVRDMISKLE
jgi:Ser/Thr protein kinase RdoA (MazF antagonist)